LIQNPKIVRNKIVSCGDYLGVGSTHMFVVEHIC
jgi:hypothetical protein